MSLSLEERLKRMQLGDSETSYTASGRNVYVKVPGGWAFSQWFTRDHVSNFSTIFVPDVNFVEMQEEHEIVFEDVSLVCTCPEYYANHLPGCPMYDNDEGIAANCRA
jgi:hypothetical protein